MSESTELAKCDADKPLPEQLETIEGLSEHQKIALFMLIDGNSVADISELLEIARSTIYRWMNSHEKFREIYEEWQDNVLASVRRRMIMLSDQAASAVERALEAGDAKTGMALLNKLQVIQAPSIRAANPDMNTERG